MSNTALCSKVANLGGSGGEIEFEQAFSSLAYAYLRDKAPQLLEFMIGFQLVDRNEDNTKAIGIFGFQVGDQWLYAPVFFLNGDLKGHELLYVKTNDSFVPLQESWVNYILSRKPRMLGEKSEKNTFELGGLMPNVRGLSIRPNSGGSGKVAQDSRWLEPVLPMLAAFKTQRASSLYRGEKDAALNQSAVVKHLGSAALVKLAAELDLNNVIPTSPAFLVKAHSMMDMYPGIKRAMHQFYGEDCLERWALDYKERTERIDLTKMAAVTPIVNGLLIQPEPAPEPVDHQKSGELRMYVYEQVFTDDTPELDDAERERLLHDTVLIKDHRKGEQVSVAYNTQVEAKLYNPSETDLYRVLERPGKFTKMLVLMRPMTNAGVSDFVTVVRVDDSGNKGWQNTYANCIFGDQTAERYEWDDWFEGLSDRDSLEVGGRYVGVSPNKSSIAPFVVNKKLEDGGYLVSFRTETAGRPLRDNNRFRGFSSFDDEYISEYNAKMLLNPAGKDGTKLRAIQGELRVPEDVKFLRIEAPKKPKQESSLLDGCCGEAECGGSEPSPITLGKIEDIQLLFHEKTARLRVYNNSTEVNMTSPLGRQQLSKRGALLSLVGDHGLTEKVAREILRESEQKGSVTYRIEYAPGYGRNKQAAPNESVLAGGPSSPPYFDATHTRGMEQLGHRKTVPSSYGDEAAYEIPQLASSRTDPNIWDPWLNYQAEDFQKSVGVAQQAGDTGQKEIFDTAVISGMLKSVRQDSLVDKHLGKLMTALDSLGRLLMNFYWHQEEFEDRYGKSDMPELEDGLRNSFEALGDIAIFLKEKTIDPIMGGDAPLELREVARN